jgi:hypothetical protein
LKGTPGTASTSGSHRKRRPLRSLAIIMAAAAGTIALLGAPALADTGPNSPGAAQSAARITVRPADASGFVSVVEDRTGSCFDIPGGTSAPGTGVQEFHCHGGVNQKFLPQNLGNGFFLLQNKGNLLCLAAASNDPLARVVQVGCTFNDPRQWWQFQLVPQDPSHLWLASGLTGKCAQLDPDSAQDGSRIDVDACIFDNRMFWHFQ